MTLNYQKTLIKKEKAREKESENFGLLNMVHLILTRYTSQNGNPKSFRYPSLDLTLEKVEKPKGEWFWKGSTLPRHHHHVLVMVLMMLGKVTIVT